MTHTVTSSTGETKDFFDLTPAEQLAIMNRTSDFDWENRSPKEAAHDLLSECGDEAEEIFDEMMLAAIRTNDKEEMAFLRKIRAYI